jgi:hypothetical protein
MFGFSGSGSVGIDKDKVGKVKFNMSICLSITGSIV